MKPIEPVTNDESKATRNKYPRYNIVLVVVNESLESRKYNPKIINQNELPAPMRKDLQCHLYSSAQSIKYVKRIVMVAVVSATTNAVKARNPKA